MNIKIFKDYNYKSIEDLSKQILHKLKIGDGVHTYAELAYLQAGDEIVTQGAILVKLASQANAVPGHSHDH